MHRNYIPIKYFENKLMSDLVLYKNHILKNKALHTTLPLFYIELMQLLHHIQDPHFQDKQHFGFNGFYIQLINWYKSKMHFQIGTQTLKNCCMWCAILYNLNQVHCPRETKDFKTNVSKTLSLKKKRFLQTIFKNLFNF